MNSDVSSRLITEKKVVGTGLDTVRVQLPVHGVPELRAGSAFTQRRTLTAETGEVRDLLVRQEYSLPGVDFLELRQLGDGGCVLVAEFSVPKYLKGTNLAPAPVSQLEVAFMRLAGELGSQCGLHVDVDPSGVRLARVDIAHDFHEVEGVSRVLRGLRDAPCRDSRIGRVSYDSDGATLVRGSRSSGYRAQLYDKTVQSSGAWGGQVPGHVRFEVQLRGRRRLVAEGLDVLSSVLGTDLDAIAHRFFVRVGFDTTLTLGSGESWLQQHLPQLSGCDQQGVMRVVGYEVCRNAGVGVQLSAATVRKYRSIQRDLGMVGLSWDRTDDRSLTACRLDWASGRLAVDGPSAVGETDD